MSRLFIIVVLVGLAVLALGVVLIGSFPPEPATHPVDRVLPNDRFDQQHP